MFCKTHVFHALKKHMIARAARAAVHYHAGINTRVFTFV